MATFVTEGYLKVIVIDLSRGNIHSTFRRGEARYVAGVTVQEVPLVVFDPCQDNGASQRIDEVLFVRMKPHAKMHLT